MKLRGASFFGLSSILAAAGLYACGGTGGASDDTGTGGSDTTGTGGSGAAGKAGAGGSAVGGGGKAGSSAGAAGKAGSSPGGNGGSGGGMGGSVGFGGNGGGAACATGMVICEGNAKKTCDGKGGFTDMMACPQACADGLGCVACLPGTGTCMGDTANTCKPDGSGFEMTVCDADLGLKCNAGKCGGACSKDSLERSYIGCEYFPTVSSNGQLFDGFHFAIAVANTTTAPANVKVLKGTTVASMVTVMPGQLQTIQLPWVPELKNDYSGDASALGSALVKSGAYHVKSDQPVTVYQFNPLEFEIPPTGACPDQAGTGKCNSFTNDASLLLPVNVLGNAYIGASSAALSTQTGAGIPGFLSIIATADKTMVTVKSSAHVRAGNGVKAMNVGDMQTFTMDTGDVVQLLTAQPNANELTNCQSAGFGGPTVCVVPKAYDLTGTAITSDKPVAVLGGHDCTYLPFNKPACDHIEETIFPANALGKDVIVTAPQSVGGAAKNDGNPDQHFVRVISAVDNNTITLDPLPPGASNGTLNKGQYADVPITNLDIQIKGTGPLLVSQYMLGGDQVDPGNSGTPQSKGDPSMSLGIPSAQFRTSYTFLAPASYTYSFVNIVLPMGESVMLDGQPVTSPAPKPIGNSGYGVIRKAIAGTPHTMTGTKPFGIVIYGYGSYTSYMYPGGLNLSVLP
jgi:hypothetical protein